MESAKDGKNHFQNIPFLQGILRSCFLFGSLYLPIQIFRVLFVAGLKGSPVIAAAIVLGIGLMAHTILKTKIEIQLKVFWGLSFITGGLSSFAGLLALFSFDSQNVPSVIILTTLLFTAYFVWQLELGLYIPPSGENSTIRVVQKWHYGLGVALPPFLIFLVIWLSPILFKLGIYLDTSTNTISDGSLFFGLGIYYILLPFISSFLPKRVPNSRSEEIPEKTPRITSLLSKLSFQMITMGLLFVLLSSLFLYSVIIVGSESTFIAFFAIAVGLFVGILLSAHTRDRIIAAWLAGGGVMGIYAWFSVDPTIVHAAFFIFFLSFILGIIIATLIGILTAVSSLSGRSLHIWGFTLMLLITGAGFLAGQIRWLVRDLSEWLIPGNILVGGIVLFSIIITSFTFLRPIDWQHPFFNFAEKISSELALIPRKIKKTLGISSMFSLLIIPSFLGLLFTYSRPGVTITLPQVMYTVDGDAVTEVYLPARSAKILLYHNPNAISPKPSSSIGNEAIRPGKTIRLGAYLYGGTENITAAEAVDWIGNNLDVFSLGGWPGGFFVPDDILTIRTINPTTRFYVMTFATSFYHEIYNPDCWNLNKTTNWGCHFNETMLNWTLKLKDGTEAYGVRRGKGDNVSHLMDLGNMEWAEFFGKFFNERAKNFHADGVAADEVMWNGYWGTNEADLRDYSTIAEIKESGYRWLQKVDENMEVELMTQAFWDEAQQYQQGIWGELAFRAGGAYGGRVDDRMQNIFYESLNWTGIVDNMFRMASANKSYIWAAWYNRDDPEALEYSIATYLMGKPNNCTWLGFHPQPVYNGGYPANLAGYDMSTVRDEVNRNRKYFDLELGQSLGYMFEIEGKGGKAWQRNYDGGIVLVNPYHAQIPGFQTNDAVFAPSH
jgi:hypothetical protein